MPQQEETKSPSRFKAIFKKLFLLAFGLFMGLCCAEVALRIVGYWDALPYQPDEYTATRLRPNLEFRYTREGDALVKVNSHGNRDVERSIEKPDNVIRIAILGDSFCEARQVQLKQAFWHILESKLNSEFPEKQFEVLNFGVSGFGTAQEYLMLKHYAIKFQPDFVLLGFFSGNDIADNSDAIKPGQIKPYFRFQDDALQLDDSFTRSDSFVDAISFSTQFNAGLINQFRVLQLANQIKSNVSATSTAGPNRLNELGLSPEIYAEPTTKEWIEGWKITEALLVKTKRFAEENGAKFGLFTVSNSIQVDPDSKLRDEFMAKLKVNDLFYPEKRLTQFCDSKKIRLLALAPKLLDSAKESKEYFHGFSNTKMGTGHWNPAGHQAAANIIFEEWSDWFQTAPNEK